MWTFSFVTREVAMLETPRDQATDNNKYLRYFYFPLLVVMYITTFVLVVLSLVWSHCA